MNGLTKKDIKNSIDFKWRLHNIAIFILDWTIAVILVALIYLPVFIDDIKAGALGESTKIFLWVVGGLGLIFSVYPLYNLIVALMFLKKYPKFKLYETTLDKANVSRYYRLNCYYTLEFGDSDGVFTADTNPCFSSALLFAKFKLTDYNNKTVRCLYDSENENVYLVDVVCNVN